MSDGVRSHRFGPALLVALLAAAPVQAQIVTDGSVGPKVSLRGGQIEIGADLGSRRGDNLFHSFEKFNIASGQTATFTGPGTIKNVISRVTGGEISTIDGTLASRVGQADLYFLNPAGVMFGPNATLDVPGSFHVSTAHELRFADGARFSALDKTSSGLTVAAPEAFGFLDRPAGRIAVDQSQLLLRPGKTLSLVGGDLTVDGGETGGIGAEDGKVHLTSATGPGAVRIADAATAVSQQGDIHVSQDIPEDGSNLAVIDVSGRNDGGTIRIRGGRVVVDGAQIFADNYGSRASVGGVDLQADHLVMHNGIISSDTFGRGKAGTVAVTGRELELHNGAVIGSDTYGPGDAGQVTVKADRLLVANADAAGFNSVISSSAKRRSTGRGGTVTVTARELELHEGGRIGSLTFGPGDAGQVTVKADRLLVAGVNAAGYNSLIFGSTESSTGHGATVAVTARELELRDGGQIGSGTWGPGDAGQVTINADRLLASGGDPVTGYHSQIAGSAEPGSTGQAGTMAVTARELELHDGSQIASVTWGAGPSGQIIINSGLLFISGYSQIASAAEPGSTGRAGSVTVTARELELHGGGTITSSTSGSGNAGQIAVDANRLLISGIETAEYGTQIAGSAEPGSTGQAGSVTVTARELELHDGGQIASSTWGPGDAGQINIDANRLLISGTDATRNPSGIFSSANPGSTGAGGTINIQARSILLQDQGLVTAHSTGTGSGGSLTIRAKDTLRLDNAAIETRTETANGGDIVLAVSRLFDLHDSRVTTSVAGGTGSGGNITIDPPLMVLDNSRIQANAQQGAGGNITIRAGQLIRTPDSVITASGSVNGNITIAAPNTDVSSSLTVLPGTFLDASTHLREACAARGGRPASSLTAGGHGGLPPDPGAPLAASPIEQPLKQQTASGSPTALTPRSLQAAKPITVAGTPQPVLGSPRPTCRG